MEPQTLTEDRGFGTCRRQVVARVDQVCYDACRPTQSLLDTARCAWKSRPASKA